jgi:hypothetical protein
MIKHRMKPTEAKTMEWALHDLEVQLDKIEEDMKVIESLLQDALVRLR